MRMWLTDPHLLCRQHLLGEHNEIHMLVGSIRKNKGIKGFIDGRLIETASIIERHEELVIEMKRRGMNHQSPLPEFSVTPHVGLVCRRKNLEELARRCDRCRRRISCPET